MTYRTVCNQTTMELKRNGQTQANEMQKGGFAVVPNSPNNVNFNTVPEDGTPIVYLAHEHRPCGVDQYDGNAVPEPPL